MGKYNIFRNWDRHQKKWYGKWHLYLGIIAGAIIAVIGITGSILVFRDEIDSALNPGMMEVLAREKRLTPDEVYTVFHQQHPDIVINYIYQPNERPTSTYIFYNYAGEQQIFVNPFNGQICGKRLYESGFINVVMDIHTSLLVPRIGQYITGTASFILLILTLSGLRLWIPRKWKKLKELLTVKFHANWKRQNYDWHNVLGFYSAPVVYLLALTGFCITFYLPIVAVLFLLDGKSPKAASEIYAMQSAYTAGKTALPMERIIRIGKKVFPEGKPMGIALPAGDSGSYRLDLTCPDISRDGKREMVAIDQYSGKVLATSRSFPHSVQGLLSWMQPLHYGSFGGLPTRILALLGGLIPAALFVTGFIIWWPRWKKQRHKPEKKKKPDSLPLLNNTGYFIFHLRYGFRYAFWTAIIAALCGMLYGLVSGILWQPAAYALLFTAILVFSNFVAALLLVPVNLLLAVFHKSYRPLWRYITISLAFFLLFLFVYLLLLNTGIKVF